jgi:hypothetical protein
MQNWVDSALGATFSYLPLEGGGRRASDDASRVGVNQNHPTPAARKMLAADPPPPGEGEERKASAAN